MPVASLFDLGQAENKLTDLATLIVEALAVLVVLAVVVVVAVVGVFFVVCTRLKPCVHDVLHVCSRLSFSFAHTT